DKLEQVLAGKLLALSHDSGQAPILEVNGMPLAALSSKVKADRRALHLHMLVPHGRQTERVVVPGVLLVAHADERGPQQPDNGGQDFLARQATTAKITSHPLA